MSGNVRSEIRFSLIPDWLLGKVSSRAYEVYGVLASHASYETGETFVGLRTIAERLGCSEDTVSRAISELRDSGSILVEERFASSGRRTTNLYTLLAKPAEVPGTDEGDPPGRSAGYDPGMDTGTIDEIQSDETQSDDSSLASLPATCPSCSEIVCDWTCPNPRGGPQEPALRSNGKLLDPLWEFFVDHDTFALPTTTPEQERRVGRLVRELRGLVQVPTSEDEVRDTYRELREKANRWPELYDDATLTPEAFVKHFVALGRPPLRGSRSKARTESLRSAVENLT